MKGFFLCLLLFKKLYTGGCTWIQYSRLSPAAVAVPEAAVVLSAPGHGGPVVGPAQLSPARAAQAILLLQICCEAYLQVFMLKQTAHRCRDIYSTGSICFTNTDKKCLVWQQYLAGNFGFALHILLYWASLPSDPSVGRAGIHAELWFVPLLPCGDDASLFFPFFLLIFFLLLVILLPLVFKRRQEHSAAWTEISVDC